MEYMSNERPTTNSGDSWSGLGQDLMRNLLRTFLPVLIPLALMWVMFLVNAMTGNWLNLNLGLRPRSVDGLAGIIFMPLLHGGLVHNVSFSHIMGNTFSWLVLGGMVALVAKRFTLIMSLIWLGSGVILWVIGTPWTLQPGGGTGGLHIGASGVIYGFAAFLVAYGFLARRIGTIIVALIVLFFYGLSMIMGMLPMTAGSGVSWTGHLSGAIAGVAVAFMFTREARTQRRDAKLTASAGGSSMNKLEDFIQQGTEPTPPAKAESPRGRKRNNQSPKNKNNDDDGDSELDYSKFQL